MQILRRFISFGLCLALFSPSPALALRAPQKEDRTGLEEIERAFGPHVTPRTQALWAKTIATFTSASLTKALNHLHDDVIDKPVWEAMLDWYHQWTHPEEMTTVTSVASANVDLPESLRALLTAAALVHDHNINPQQPRTQETIDYIWTEEAFRDRLWDVARAGGINPQFAQTLINSWIWLLDFVPMKPRPNPADVMEEWRKKVLPEQWPNDWTYEQVLLASRILWIADVSALYIMPDLKELDIRNRLRGLDKELGRETGFFEKGTANFLERYVTADLTNPLPEDGRGRSLLDLLDEGLADRPYHDAWDRCLDCFPQAGLATPATGLEEIVQIGSYRASIVRVQDGDIRRYQLTIVDSDRTMLGLQNPPPAEGDLFIYSIKDALRGAHISPELRGQRLLRSLLNLFFRENPTVRTTHTGMKNFVMLDVLARDYGFMPEDPAQEAEVWIRRVSEEGHYHVHLLHPERWLLPGLMGEVLQPGAVTRVDSHDENFRPVYLGQVYSVTDQQKFEQALGGESFLHAPATPPPAVLRDIWEQIIAQGESWTRGPLREILVVEDNDLVRNLMEAYLNSLKTSGVLESGIRITIVTSAEAARESFNEETDFIITDINMPGMSGTYLLDDLREQRPDVPAIVMSGDISQVKETRPSTIYLQKPFRMSDVSVILQTVQGRIATSPPAGMEEMTREDVLSVLGQWSQRANSFERAKVAVLGPSVIEARPEIVRFLLDEEIPETIVRQIAVWTTDEILMGRLNARHIIAASDPIALREGIAAQGFGNLRVYGNPDELYRLENLTFAQFQGPKTFQDIDADFGLSTLLNLIGQNFRGEILSSEEFLLTRQMGAALEKFYQ